MNREEVIMLLTAVLMTRLNHDGFEACLAEAIDMYDSIHRKLWKE